MEKITFLILLAFIITLISKNFESDKDAVEVSLNPSDPNTEYLGKWYNDSTFVGGNKNMDVNQLEFEFQEPKLFLSSGSSSNTNITYDSWNISGNILIGINYNGPEGYIIKSPPTNGKLILSKIGTFEGEKEVEYTYYLSK